MLANVIGFLWFCASGVSKIIMVACGLHGREQIDQEEVGMRESKLIKILAAI